MDGPKNRNRQSPSAKVGIGDVMQVERPLALKKRGPAGKELRSSLSVCRKFWEVGGGLSSQPSLEKPGEGDKRCGGGVKFTIYTRVLPEPKKTTTDVVKVKEL